VNIERHSVLEAGVRFVGTSGIRMSLRGFQREVSDAILFRPQAGTTSRIPAVEILGGAAVKATGVSLDIRLPVWKFELRGVGSWLQYEEDSEIASLYPRFGGTAELIFHDSFFDGSLDATAGIRARGMTQYQGMEFVPQMVLFVENRGDGTGPFATLDVYGIFRIGDAYINIALENITNAKYYIVPVYPMPDFNIKFGVNWQFLD
jgi:hypothetical protein